MIKQNLIHLGTLVVIFLASAIGGCAGAHVFQIFSPIQPVREEIVLMTGVVKSINVKDRSFTASDIQRNGERLIAMRLRPEAQMLKRKFVFEDKTIVGVKDTVLQHLEALVPGSPVQVFYIQNDQENGFQVLKVITGDLLPIE